MSIFALKMLSINRKREIVSLKQKKYRQRYSQFLVEGEKSVIELCQSDFLIHEILITQTVFDKIGNSLPASKVLIVNEKDMNQLSTLDTPAGIIAVSNFQEYSLDNIIFKKRFVLLLDNINDPGNLGTIIRIADWYGIEGIVCSPTCVDQYNSKTILSSMGSFTRVKVVYESLLPIITRYQIPSYACVMQGESIQNITKPEEGIIIIGNESNGISKPIEDSASFKITIPKAGEAESLNAAIATAIVCHKFVFG